MVAYACNSSTLEGDHKFQASLSYIVRLCLRKQRAGDVAQGKVLWSANISIPKALGLITSPANKEWISLSLSHPIYGILLQQLK
jgi:hypothetical protein